MIRRSVPILDVRDAVASARWYEQVFGFFPAWSWGEPPTYVSVKRGGAEIHLTQVGGRPKGGGACYVFCSPSDLDWLYHNARAEGALVHEPLAPRTYGMRDCAFLDLDGNEVCFGAELDPVEDSEEAFGEAP